MHSRAPVGFATLLAALLVARGATAGGPSPRVRLAWVRADGAESCPSYAAVVEGVSRRLGRNPFIADASRSIEGVVSREGERWVARLYVRESDGALEGSRELASEAESCEAIGQAVTLAMALTIDPEAAMRVAAATSETPRAAPSAAPVVTTPPPPPPPPPVSPPSRPLLTSRPGLAGAIDVHAIGVLGVLPAAAAGADVVGDVAIVGRLRASVAMLFVPAVYASMPDDRFAFGLTSGVVRGCVDALRIVAFALAGCGGLWVGGITATELGRPSTRPGQQVWIGAAVEVRASLRLLGPLTLDAGVGLLVPITRYRFFVEGSGRTVYQQPIAAGNAYLGLGIAFR